MHSSCGVLRQGIKNLLFVVESKNTSLFASSPILRRQQFLIRVLKGCESGRLMMSGTNVADALEVDAEEILRAITTPLDLDKHKGQAGRVAIIGGCREYTGAPYFAAISALKIGADLSHVFCTKDAAGVIKSYSPELIVHPLLEESYSVRDEEKAAVQKKVLEEVSKWIERFDCLVVGPGLGRDPFLMDCVAEIILIAREAKIPIVVDGDGLFLVTNKIQLVEGYPLAVLTPNVNEYKRLVEKVLGDENSAQVGPAKLKLLAERIGGLTIVQKGKADVISDGEVAVAISLFGSPRRCGGQGDILSGSIAVFSSWARRHVESAAGANDSFPKNPMVLGSIAGSVLLRKAASLAFSKRKRSTLTTDIIECIGESMEEISPSGY